jgi:hypothetical protein
LKEDKESTGKQIKKKMKLSLHFTNLPLHAITAHNFQFLLFGLN